MTAAPSLPEIKIDARASADEARAFLERDRLMAAYALADIDQPEIEGARWWIARRDGEIAAVVMVVEGLPFRPCFATGASDRNWSSCEPLVPVGSTACDGSIDAASGAGDSSVSGCCCAVRK